MGIESKIKPKPKPKPETSESRRGFLKFLGFSTVYNPLPFINELAKINTNTDKETKNNIELSNFDPEKVFKEAQVLYTEYITSDDYMLRLKLLFFRADKFKDSKYIPEKSFEDTFGDFDAINIEFENLTTEEQRKYVSRAISFRAEKMEEVNNIEHKFFDKLSDDLERNEKTQASMINVESFKKILSKTKKSEQIEILNILYTPEVVEYILESINSPKIKNFIIIKNPDTTWHPNFFLQDIIHELVHINHSSMPFIDNELFIKMSKDKIEKTYLSETKEIEAFFQSMLIMLKKYKLIDNYNDIPTNIFTKLDERSDQILQKLEDEKDILSSEEKRLLIAEANFLSNYGEIIQYLINMLRINRNKNKEEPVELTEKDAIWLLKNLASVDDVDLPEESNVKNLMNNIRSSIIFLLAKNLPKEEGVEQYS